LYIRLSGLDFLHFYGYGNETDAPDDEDFYKVKSGQYILQPSLLTPLGNWTATVRASAQYAKTDLNQDNFIATAPPYGSADFFQTSAGAGLSIDTRDSEATPTRGYYVSMDGNLFPPIGAVESTFGEVSGTAAYYQPIPVGPDPTLALRVGGKQVWGAYPWHEAAYIGGAQTVRGLPSQRYAGDASLYGNAELRIPLSRIYIFVPGRLGVFGLGDVGRVFLDGETSHQWHSGAGGGIWLTFISPENTISAAAAASDEGTRFYVRAGGAF
jgi:outer membrane protein assembly factor BamA